MAPFIFVKDILIEELEGEYSKSSAWSKISPSDFYPAITLYSWSDEQIVLKGRHVVADFDTGCPVLVFDEAEIDETILSDMELQLSSLYLNQPYDYRLGQVKVAVLTKDGKLKAMPFLIRLVRKWRKSPFCAINPARKALVGRDLALRRLLNLLLKSDEKKTEILK
ncbi:MAG: hypothetical protein ONB46_25745 [candidate division KSB1 bacterium]|nr:hypothetical protein [candidate division KSB1 bacterium]MDZ7369338.1 hypothetical protein [candidate division KSB1 bacterium]MDZ7407360.1 hypothetical protein [candidate division KSB1 bacterium]